LRIHQSLVARHFQIAELRPLLERELHLLGERMWNSSTSWRRWRKCCRRAAVGRSGRSSPTARRSTLGGGSARRGRARWARHARLAARLRGFERVQQRIKCLDVAFGGINCRSFVSCSAIPTASRWCSMRYASDAAT
jgi:hypothetical protein